MVTLRIIRRYLATAFCLMAMGCQLGTLPPSVTGPPICNAQHAWESFHLPHWALKQPVVIHNTSSYVVDLEAWNTLEGNPIRLVDDGDPLYFNVGGFIIEVKDGGDAESGWLGLATIRANSAGHISYGVVTMNLTKLAQYGPNVAAHVLAQEIGHILGLAHQRKAVPPSAMDDCQGRGDAWFDCLDGIAGTVPNPHDGDQLAIIYKHVPVKLSPPSTCQGEGEVQILLHAFMAEDLGGST